jgi:hypothetical protein
MDAIRQFIDVKDHSFKVSLPKEFNARRVEIIILPSEMESDIPQWHKEILDNRLQDYLENPSDVMDFDTFCDELEKEL